MTLTVENGTSVSGADAYASLTFVDAYWTARSHMAFSTAWDEASLDAKEGAIREATAYLDAVYNQSYRGIRSGDVQSLEWPRTRALDDAGWPLQPVPNALRVAVAELSVRALTSPLATDEDVAGTIKSTKDKIGPIETSIEYLEGTERHRRFGVVEDILAPILNGTQASAKPMWNWR